MSQDSAPEAEVLVSEPRRAVIYLRVSTTGQADTDYSAEGFSIPAQREACLRAAERLEASVVDEYVDRGESARSAARPALQRLLKRLSQDQDVDFVIVHKVDRLARSREDDVAIALAIRKSGAQLVSATENIDETPSGKLLHGIMATIAEFYSANLAAEAKKGMLQKVKLGGTPSIAPIGYLNVSERIDGKEVRTVIVDPERSPNVKWAFEAFATGDFTIRQLTEALEARGLRTRATKKMPSKPLSLSRVHKMLRHPYYVGLVPFDGALYEGRHQPLVSAELFQQVQDVLDGHRRRGERPHRRTHYLKGSLFCGLCRRMLSIGYSRGRGGVYPYFFCLGRHRDKRCRLPYLSFDAIEEMMEDYWREVRIAPEQLDQVRSDVKAHIARTTSQHEAERERQLDRLRQLQAQSKKLLQAHYADAIPLDLLREEQARIIREQAEAETVLESLATEQAALQAALQEALGFLDSASALYLGGTHAVRRELNQALFHKLWVVPDGIAGADLASPFAELLTDDLSERLEREGQLATEGRQAEIVSSGPAGRSGWRPPRAWRLERPRGLLPAETENTAPEAEPGSNVTVLVGKAGFEPATSASRTLRANQAAPLPVGG